MVSTGSDRAGDRGRDASATKGRLRLVVVQALVLVAVRDAVRAALVHPGARRRGLPGPGRRAVGPRARRAAGPRPDRRRHGPPAGRQPHVVGGQPRPHACCTRWPTTQQATLLQPALAGGRRCRCKKIRGPHAALRRARLGRRAPAGTARPTSRCRSPRTSAQQVAVSILEQAEDFPAVLVEPQNVRAYPSPYGINAAHVLGYLSPITADELDEAKAERRHLRARRLRRRPGRPGEGVRPVPPRAARLQAGRRRLDGPGARRLRRGRRAAPATPWSPRSTRGCRRVVEQQLAADHQDRPQDLRQGHRQELRRRLRRRRGDGRQERPGRRDGQRTRRTTRRCGSAASPPSSSSRLYSAKAGNPLLFRATQGQFAPGSTWKPIMTAGALNNGFSPSTRLDCSSGFQVGNRLVQELRVRVLRPHRLRQALQISCDTFFYRVGYQLLAEVRHRRRRRERQGPAGRRRPRSSASASPPASTSPARPAAGSPTGTGSWPTGRPTRATTARSARSPATTSCTSSPASSASRATPTAPATRSTSSIGQGDTLVTPLQLGPGVRRALQRRHALRAARRQGRRRPGRQGDQRDQAAEGRATSSSRRGPLKYVDHALLGTAKTGTLGLEVHRLPARQGARSAPRPGRPRCTASRAPRGSRRTTRTTSC